MILEINDQEYSFKFGIRFLREMDKKYTIQQNGIPFGASMQMIAAKLLTGDITALMQVLTVASETEKPKVKESELECYIEELDDIEKFLDDVMEELKNSNATKLGFTQAVEEIQGNMKKK